MKLFIPCSRNVLTASFIVYEKCVKKKSAAVWKIFLQMNRIVFRRETKDDGVYFLFNCPGRFWDLMYFIFTARARTFLSSRTSDCNWTLSDFPPLSSVSVESAADCKTPRDSNWNCFDNCLFVTRTSSESRIHSYLYFKLNVRLFVSASRGVSRHHRGLLDCKSVRAATSDHYRVIFSF